MIEPIPRLKLKNACPIALKKVVASTSEKLGENKKLKPLIKSPLIIALITMMIIRTNNVGINKRTIRSIPPITPAARIAILNPINTVCQNNNLGAEAVTRLNCSTEEMFVFGIAAMPM